MKTTRYTLGPWSKDYPSRRHRGKDDAIAMLRRIESINQFCVICAAEEHIRHMPDCELMAVIRGAADE